MLRPRTVSEAATSSLATIAEVDQPIVIDDDDDVGRTGISSSSVAVSKETPSQLQTKRRPMLKSAPVARPKVLLKSPPVALTKVPPPVERYAVPKGPVVPVFDISDFPMTLPGLSSSIGEQVQIEIDAIMREAEEKRAKRSKDQQQLYDDVLSAIFKSVFEDTVPDSAGTPTPAYGCFSKILFQGVLGPGKQTQRSGHRP